MGPSDDTGKEKSTRLPASTAESLTGEIVEDTC